MNLCHQLTQVVLPLHSAIEIFVVKLELRQDILVTRHTAHQSHHKHTTSDLLELIVLTDAVGKLPKLRHNARVITHEILHKRWAEAESQRYKQPIIHRAQCPGNITWCWRGGQPTQDVTSEQTVSRATTDGQMGNLTLIPPVEPIWHHSQARDKPP